ncbi:MAG: hypothetical protein M3Z23_06130 [Acidobacteriota bacterium]|nr:hypothetical protein [Acidobacteriota bacterium]
MKALVESGALPRVRLARAEEAVADAQDVAFLRQTLYGQDLTAEQADEMVAVAQRRLERRRQTADEQQKLVVEGVISRAEMTTSLEDVDRANKEYDWAVSRAKLVRELAEMAKAELILQHNLENSPANAPSLAERYDGNGVFTPALFQKVENAFQGKFSKSLPISAMGETAVHRALGFDHRNRVDVAIVPDQAEGVWLRHYLVANRIPYFAFRAAVAHKATGAHIHIGPQSTRMISGG